MEAEPQAPLVEPAFHLRLGLLLVAPRSGLRGILERKQGAVRDAFLLVLVSAIAFRLPELVRAVLSFSQISFSGGLTRTIAVAGGELRTAAFVTLVAALVITVFAGRGRRDPSLGLELGAACYVPYFAVLAPLRLFDTDAFLGYVPVVAGQVARVAAWIWVAAMVGLSLRLVRQGGATSPPSQPTRARFTGLALLAVPALSLVLGTVWSARHYELLRPLGRLDKAPEFSLARADGKPGAIRLADLRGKVVLLDFWATWCPPCLAMLPTLHELYAEWQPRGAEFVGIDSDGPMVAPDELRGFLSRRPFPYPVVVDDKEVGGLYGVFSIPHLVVIGRDGAIARVFVGGVSRSQLDAALRTASEATSQ